MDLRHLKYFLAVAEELNIGRAPTRLHMSQPPLTRQIRALEDELGVELFLRTAKGVELTQAGELFRQEASNIRMLVEGAVDRVQRVGAGKLGRLDVGVFGSAIYDTIPRLLEAFRSRLPGVSVVLHSMNKEDQMEALLQRRLTVAFNRMTTPHPGICREIVALERLFVVVPVLHEWAGRTAVQPRELEGRPLILYPNVGRPNFVDHVRSLCQSLGFEPQIAQEVGDAATSMALVSCGFGLTLIPESAAQSVQVRGTAFVPLDGPPEVQVDLSCLYRASDRSPLLRAFLEVVREHQQRKA